MARYELWYLCSNFCWSWICCCFFQNLSLYLPVFYCKIFSILIIFLRWLQVVLVICCSRFTRFTNELYIILMMAFANINYFSKFNLFTFLETTLFNLCFNCTSDLLLLYCDSSPLIFFAWIKLFLGVLKSWGWILLASCYSVFIRIWIKVLIYFIHLWRAGGVLFGRSASIFFQISTEIRYHVKDVMNFRMDFQNFYI